MARKKRKPDGEAPDPQDPNSVPKPELDPPLTDWQRRNFPPGMVRVRYGRVEVRRLEFMAKKYLLKAEKARNPIEWKINVTAAIQLWPDCAQGYVMLAERASSPKQAIALYEKGVAAGGRALCPEFFAERAGSFGFDDETGPYLTARLGLARALWVVGRRAETVAHYDEILRLNPADHQGVRYNLAAALLEMGRDAELASLLKRYPDEASASWAYCVALFAFRKKGDTPAAGKLLEAALERNRHVPDYLTGVKPMPLRLPASFVPGDRNEAIDYAVGFLNAWRATPGALAWIKKGGAAGATVKPKKARSVGRGPTVATKKRLLKLALHPQVTWQADARRLPIWIKIAGQPCRPWVLVVASRNEELILAQQVLETPPTLPQVWDTLARAMSSKAPTPPHRPGRVELGGDLPLEGLSGHLDDLGIHLVRAGELDLVDDIFAKLSEHVSGRPLPLGLLEMPAVGPEQVAAYFRAAATFYRAAPWQRVGGGETFKVECDRFESGPWYAVVIGQMGMTRGLALYEDLDALLRMRDSVGSDEENTRQTVALSVTFGDQTELPVADLDAAERLGWEIADPDAYPAAIRKERGLMIRPPLAWELRLLEACLLTLSTFIADHDRDDTQPGEYDVSTEAGPLRLSISWINGGA